MPSNAVQQQLDVAQLTSKIRGQIDRVSSTPSIQAHQDPPGPVAVPSTANLRSIDEEIQALAAHVENGEPSPAQTTSRGRLGAIVKQRLYRLLWWHTRQLKTLAALVSRRGEEEARLIESLAERIGSQASDVGNVNQAILDSKRQIFETENRLKQLEASQLRLQALDVERNVKGATQLEAELSSFRQQLDIQLGEITRDLKQQVEVALGRQDSFLQQVDAIRQENAEHRQELSARISQESTPREQLAVRLSELALFTHQTRTALTLQDRRLTLFIEEARKRLPEPFTHDQLRELADKQKDYQHDSIYVAFEDTFRGSREEIKERQSIYLPMLKESGLGTSDAPVLDLGCGRGEWLELLREHGLQASGVDRNAGMVEGCKSLGLQVTLSDVLPHMRTLPDASLGAVTSFHMVEHLPFDDTLALVDESLRLLRSGGILILETPNPQNILVGAHAFHFDPTHLKPLPSPMLRFFVEARGFCDAHILELHPYPEAVRFPDDGKGISNRLNEYFYGPQDYAVIGRKP